MGKGAVSTNMKASPERRRAIASLGAVTMHARHPDAAKSNGSKGGERTAYGYADGPSAWARRMALARWHGLPFTYRRRSKDMKNESAGTCTGSRAPAGPGRKQLADREPGPAAARIVERPPRPTNPRHPQQPGLL
jgi:hypothetical protein